MIDARDIRLIKVCPVCKAAPGGKCLEPVKDGSQYIEHPHPQRYLDMRPAVVMHVF